MNHSLGQLKQLRSQGFTIVELLIVIVVIGILITISFISYNGIQQSARDKSLLADVENVSSELARYATKNGGVYGSALSWYSGAGTNSNIAFTPTSGNVIDVVTNKSDYCILAFNPASNSKTIATAVTKPSSPGICDALFASTAAGGAGGIVGWWKLNGNTNDDSYGARTGTAFNITPTTDKLGNANSAYTFNGTNSYISLGTDATYDYASFTVSVWAKTVGIPPHVRNIVGMGNWNQTNDWFIGFKNAQAAAFAYGVVWTAGPSYLLDSYDETQWTHYVGTVSPTQQKLYINGNLVQTIATSHVSVANTYDLQIGRSSYATNFFAGDIDDVRLYNQELSQSVITSMFTTGPK